MKKPTIIRIVKTILQFIVASLFCIAIGWMLNETGNEPIIRVKEVIAILFVINVIVLIRNRQV